MGCGVRFTNLNLQWNHHLWNLDLKENPKTLSWAVLCRYCCLWMRGWLSSQLSWGGCQYVYLSMSRCTKKLSFFLLWSFGPDLNISTNTRWIGKGFFLQTFMISRGWIRIKNPVLPMSCRWGNVFVPAAKWQNFPKDKTNSRNRQYT